MAQYHDGLVHDNPPSDLEVVPGQNSSAYGDFQQQKHITDDQPIAAHSQAPRNICGIRRTTFLLLVIIAVLILAGAIGGGVGGSLAVQNARNSALNSASNTASPSTVTATLTTSTSALPSQSITAPKLSCPDNNNAVYAAANGGKFTILCNQDHPNDDLQLLNNISTMNDCIERCAYFNRLSPSVLCVAAALAPFTNTCWIKSYVGASNTNNNIWYAQACDNC